MQKPSACPVAPCPVSGSHHPQDGPFLYVPSVAKRKAGNGLSVEVKGSSALLFGCGVSRPVPVLHCTFVYPDCESRLVSLARSAHAQKVCSRAEIGFSPVSTHHSLCAFGLAWLGLKP